MKDNLLKGNSPGISTELRRNTNNSQEHINFSPKAINTMMTEQLVMPPNRVWDKIEKILDEQDHRRKVANSIITRSFEKLEREGKRKNVYFAAVAAVGVVAGIIWKVS